MADRKGKGLSCGSDLVINQHLSQQAWDAWLPTSLISPVQGIEPPIGFILHLFIHRLVLDTEEVHMGKESLQALGAGRAP